MILRRIFFVLFILVIQHELLAQTLDPYRRINDPLAIADLGGPDSGEIMRILETGNTNLFDTDGYSIFAADTGAGMLRHLWVVYSNGLIPTDSKMKLWVDDSLLIDGTVSQFFLESHGLIRSPFDTASAGAEVFECQVPYRHGFRWTQDGDWCWHEAEWQRIPSASLPSVTSMSNFEAAADTNYWKADPWVLGTEISFPAQIPAGDMALLADIDGPAYIQKMHFHFSVLDTAILQRLWLTIQWDHCAAPSVSLPLSDIFGISMGARNIRSFRIVVDSMLGTMEITFPMPFKAHARIMLANLNVSNVPLDGYVEYRDTSWHSSWGYFATQYHITPEIAYHLFHPVLHAKGSGRYIGAIFNYPDSKFFSPVFMEGDGYMMVDSLPYSNPGISLHYTGTEDYCDGGWYFLDTSEEMPPIPPPAFSCPFRGCPNWWPTMYRFHFNAPFNFSRSIDVDFGHGFNDDYTTTYRTVAFYYKQWTPFYPSSDTIIAGNTWTITGAGYAPDTSIIAMLDTDTIYRGKAASDGTISIKVNVPPSWAIGNHVLSINGIEKPEWITMLAAPKLLYLQDSAGPIFSEYDSINVRAYGFKPDERLTLQLGDTLVAQTPMLIADSDGVIRLKTFLPWVPQGIYHLNVIRADGSKVTSDSSFYVTRALDYEFELLPNPGGGAAYSYLSYSDRHWSQGAIAFCGGNWKLGSTFTFQFQVPFADSFSTTVFGTIGNRYAIYRTYIDSADMGLHDWFWDVPWGTIARDSTILPNIYLTAGVHTMKFVNEGWDDSAVEYSIAPDDFLLQPLSPQSGSQEFVESGTEGTLSIFPNPINESSLSISGIPDSVGTISVALYNEVGQEVFQTLLAQQIGIRTLNVSPVANGSYWLSLALPTGMKFIHLNILR